MIPRRRRLTLAVLMFLAASGTQAQFLDSFDGPTIDGWFTMTGDGDAKAALVVQNGFARLQIDATADQHGVWYTLINLNSAVERWI